MFKSLVHFNSTLIVPLLFLGFTSLDVSGEQDAIAIETIKIEKDLSYKQGDLSDYESARCKLDLYLPANVKDFPTIVWFHGGGIQNGDKTSDIAVDFGNRFAKEGIAVASVNYRLYPQVKYPGYIEDAAAAVAFIKKTIAKYGGSPEKVFVSGHSAGGYLTAMVGIDPRYLAKHELKPTDIAGYIPIAGQMISHTTVREERNVPRTQPVIDESAPSYHVKKNAPSFLNIAGGKDLPARAEENQYFVAALKATGHKDVEYLEVEERDHGTIASKVGDPNDIVAKTILEFIAKRSSHKE